jgi:hypothetical protein
VSIHFVSIHFVSIHFVSIRFVRIPFVSIRFVKLPNYMCVQLYCTLGEVDFGVSISYSLQLMGKIILKLK